MVLRAMRVGVVRLRRLRSGSTPRDNGWDRVPRDAAAAGHVDMVMFCLDEGYEGWEYTDSIMQAAESERRWNVVGCCAREEGAFVDCTCARRSASCP